MTRGFSFEERLKRTKMPWKMQGDLRREGVRSRVVVVGELDEIAQKGADGLEGGWSVLRVANLTGEHSRDSS